MIDIYFKYLKYYDYMIVVIFNPQHSENNFNEIKEGIEKQFGDKVVFIIK